MFLPSDSSIYRVNGNYPCWGLAKLDDFIYWGDFTQGKLQSSKIPGTGVVLLSNETTPIQHFTLVSSSQESNKFQSYKYASSTCEGQSRSHT